MFDIFLLYKSTTGSAGLIKIRMFIRFLSLQHLSPADFLDFSPIISSFQHFPPSLPEEGLTRKTCFDVVITDDASCENTESFTISLELDTFTQQSGIRVDPSITEIFIVDDDGKFNVMIQKN